MSDLTDYAENRLTDAVLRGQSWSLPPSLYVGLASDATDAAIVELGGTGYARQPIARALTSWAGTQGPGTTLASSGTSHATSNNITVDFGTAGSAWGTANAAVLYDAATAGNPLIIFQRSPAIVIGSGDPVSLPAGTLSATFGLAGGLTDYLANRLIDFMLRGQAYTFPATTYAVLFTAAPSNAGGGTEVAGGGYAAVAVPSTLAAWSGTQGDGTTTASTGTSGRATNNAAIAFPVPTADWGVVTHDGLRDAPGGNLLFWAPLQAPRSVSAGPVAPDYAPGTRAIRFA